MALKICITPDPVVTCAHSVQQSLPLYPDINHKLEITQAPSPVREPTRDSLGKSDAKRSHRDTSTKSKKTAPAQRQLVPPTCMLMVTSPLLRMVPGLTSPSGPRPLNLSASRPEGPEGTTHPHHTPSHRRSSNKVQQHLNHGGAGEEHYHNPMTDSKSAVAQPQACTVRAVAHGAYRPALTQPLSDCNKANNKLYDG